MAYTSKLSFIRKNPGVIAAALMTMVAGVALTLRGPVTKVAPVGDKVLEIQTGSGSQRGFCNDLGQCSFSGSLKVQGVLFGTGTALTQASQDTRYVNISGDTMTGGLLIVSLAAGGTVPTINADNLLEIAGTTSGRTLRAMDALLSSGTLVVNSTSLMKGALTVRAAISGSTIHAASGLTTSGASVIEGTLRVSGTLTGNTVKVVQLSPLKIQAAMSGAVYVGSGVMTAMIPEYASGWSLTRVLFGVGYSGTTNATTLQIEQPRKNYRNMLSTPAQVDSTEFSSKTAATAYVIDTVADDVEGGETIFFSFPNLSTTAPKNPVVYLEISAP